LITRCHNELKTATDFALELKTSPCDEPVSGAHNDIYISTVQVVRAAFDFKQYDCAPVVFILIIKDTMFVENYHLAGRGGESPMMQISRYQRGTKKPSQLFKTYEKHFEKMWKIGEQPRQPKNE
jgi:hypothetical protein